MTTYTNKLAFNNKIYNDYEKWLHDAILDYYGEEYLQGPAGFEEELEKDVYDIVDNLTSFDPWDKLELPYGSTKTYDEVIEDAKNIARDLVQ